TRPSPESRVSRGGSSASIRLLRTVQRPLYDPVAKLPLQLLRAPLTATAVLVSHPHTATHVLRCDTLARSHGAQEHLRAARSGKVGLCVWESTEPDASECALCKADVVRFPREAASKARR